MRPILSILILLMCSLTGRAQDTLNPPSHSHFTISDNPLQNESFTFVDTVLSIKSQYELNASQQPLFGYYRLTNINQALQPTIFKLNYQVGAQLGLTTFADVYDDSHELKFYNVRSPYTYLSYRSSLNIGGATHVIHSQNVSPKLNFAASYNRERSLGFYPNDETIWNQFRLTSQYSGLRYKMRAFASLVRTSAQQHGGLAGDTTFTENQETDRTVMPMNLTNAEHRMRHFRIGINHSYRIGGNQIYFADSDTIPDTVFVSKLSAYHRAEWMRHTFTYDDDAPNFDYYGAAYLDTATTLDSTFFGRLKNTVGLTYNLFEGLVLSGGLTHEFFAYRGGARPEYNNQNLRIEGFLKYELPFATLHGKVIKGISGPDAANTYFGGALTGGSSLSWKTYAHWQLLTPGKYFLSYSGNHDQWDADIYSFNVLQMGGSLKRASRREALSIDYTGMDNVPFFQDSESIASRSGQFESVLQIKAMKGLSFGAMNWDNEIMYQAIDAVSLDLPDVVLRSSLYLNQYLFKDKPLHLQMGVTVNYTTQFNGNAYRPSTGLFYRQDETAIGNYPYIDFFLNAQVRELTAFLTLEHVNAGWFDYRYFNAPHYPTTDFVIRFGLSWSFYN